MANSHQTVNPASEEVLRTFELMSRGESGYGREHGGFGMHEFVNTKAIMITES